MKTFILSAALSLFGFISFAQKSISYKTPEERLNEEYCSGLFRSTEGTILDVSSNPSARSYINIIDWMQGRVAGLTFFTLRSGTRVPVIRGHQASVFVNEMQVNANYLDFLPTSDIAMIKIIKRPFFGGHGGGGAIAIYTLKGDEDDEQ
jgi:hypothetical protein